MKKYGKVLAMMSFAFLAFPLATSADWTGIDLPGSTPAGSFDISPESTFTITGGGGYWWVPGEKLYFVYQTVTGDCQIIAHSVTATKGNLGVMLRGGLTGKDANIAYCAWSTDCQPRGATYATSPNGTELLANGGSGWYVNYWMKLTRVGQLFSLYHKNQTTMPTDWGSATTVTITDIPTNAYIGLAVANGTATIDHVSITGTTAVRYQVSKHVVSSAKIMRTEYFSVNGQRLATRNNNPVASRNSIIIVHQIDADGFVHAGKMLAQ
jgi:hypothetical protein